MQPNTRQPKMDDGLLRDKILELVATTPAKMTPQALKATLSSDFGFDRNLINTKIRELISTGDLVYTYEHGCSFLEISFNKPMRISKHVVLKPPEHHFEPRAGDVVVNIKPGASFGAGRHPTTRLAVRGIDYALGLPVAASHKHNNSVLDIGTGTGVLVITAVLMGVERGLGIDIDDCALAEASANVDINKLTGRIQISGQSIEDIDQRFSLIVANLRYPTLKQLVQSLCKICLPAGMLVFSGIHPHECADLMDCYRSAGFENIWIEEELDWSGMVFKNTNYNLI